MNLDGKVDIGDAVLLIRYKAGLTELTDLQKSIGNVTGHGDKNNVGITDAIKIIKIFVLSH